MREQLLGYLLGALEPSEQAQLEARLADEPELRRELQCIRETLAPLEVDDEVHEPPVGLAARTYNFVRSHAGWGCWGEIGGATSGWRLSDFMVAAGIFVAASMLVFPAIVNSRVNARIGECQNKLRLLGVALSQYAQIHGHFPFVPASGNLGTAGAYAPILKQAGLLENPCQVVCPDSPLAARRDFEIPSLSSVLGATPCELPALQRNMGGDYGYLPGYVDIGSGRYLPTPHSSRDDLVLLADAADEGNHSGSVNHGRLGQNALSPSGRVRFLSIPHLYQGGDHIYVNDFGGRGAGRGGDDSSVANSGTPPLVTPVRVQP